MNQINTCIKVLDSTRTKLRKVFYLVLVELDSIVSNAKIHDTRGLNEIPLLANI